jgi:hypothetical protein
MCISDATRAVMRMEIFVDLIFLTCNLNAFFWGGVLV